MKLTVVTCLASAAIALSVLGQTPAPPDPAAAPPGPPAASSPTITPGIGASSPAAVVTPSPAERNDLESRIIRKARKHGVSITFGDDDDKDGDDDIGGARRHRGDVDFDDNAWMAVPIVGVIFTTLFGAPVLIVGLIMFFSFWKARSLHRTVRLMVEKGQPVPDALFATPSSPAKQRSDMRRGVVLVMVGIGLMVFFGAVSDWDGGAWALGIIPFLIGAGYLLVWQLEGNKRLSTNRSTDIPPPLP